MAEVVAIVGRSGAGKTTLLERVTQILTGRGLRLATVKTTHHDVHVDTPGSDTYRHGQAGSECRALVGRNSLTLWGSGPELSDIVKLLSCDRDLVLMEGGKSTACRKVELRSGESVLNEEPWLTLSRDQEQDLVGALWRLLWPSTEVQIHTVDLQDELYQQERELRNEVLLRPIGLPDHAWEQRDVSAKHIVANLDERVVGCVVLWPSDQISGAGQLMQMAVKPEMQGQGVGKRLVRKLVEVAQHIGLGRIWCHARADVVPFYEGLGFECSGAPFQEVGLEHRKMWLEMIQS